MAFINLYHILFVCSFLERRCYLLPHCTCVFIFRGAFSACAARGWPLHHLTPNLSIPTDTVHSRPWPTLKNTFRKTISSDKHSFESPPRKIELCPFMELGFAWFWLEQLPLKARARGKKTGTSSRVRARARGAHIISQHFNSGPLLRKRGHIKEILFVF